MRVTVKVLKSVDEGRQDNVLVRLGPVRTIITLKEAEELSLALDGIIQKETAEVEDWFDEDQNKKWISEGRTDIIGQNGNDGDHY